MNGALTSVRARAGRGWSIVMAGGLVAGVLDIAYAWVFWAIRAGVGFERILQSVAAGLLGSASFRGGYTTAALGLALHLFIATPMSVSYFLVARHVRPLVDRPLVFGAFYGLFLYGAMNYVVVPLSSASPGSTDPLWIALTVAVHMFLIGVPIAFASRKALDSRRLS